MDIGKAYYNLRWMTIFSKNGSPELGFDIAVQRAEDAVRERQPRPDVMGRHTATRPTAPTTGEQKIIISLNQYSGAASF
jgi:hypothetical protein